MICLSIESSCDETAVAIIKDKRERFYKWTMIIYPGDSAPENYESIINNWHIPCCLSPIHDQDLNGDETEKKKHQHLY